MGNVTTTALDQGSVIHKDVTSQDDTLTFGGAGTEPEGTILARNSVSDLLVPYVKDSVTEDEGIPVAILTFDVIAAGAGNEPIRAAIDGQFRKERCIIKADGDDSNIDAAVKDLLRQTGLVLLDVTELNIADNPAS